jgi:fido (protein-threonine AMPylation protein)
MNKIHIVEWEYKDHVLRNTELPAKATDILRKILDNQVTIENILSDSREIHRYLFENLTPTKALNYAGHYRGEDFENLKNYWVGIQDDPRVGYAPSIVNDAMVLFGSIANNTMKNLDSTNSHNLLEIDQKIYITVEQACELFEFFLRVHPYVNGNGHIARIILWGVLQKYGYNPIGWTIDTRPLDPPFSNYIKQFREGKKIPLISFVLRLISKN